MNVMRTLPRLLSDTGQKKTPEKKDGRRMSFQRPKGTIEYSVSNAHSNSALSVFVSLCVFDAFLLPWCCYCFSVCVCLLPVVSVALTSSGNILAVAVVFVCCEGTVSDHAL